MSETDQPLRCHTHGESHATFMCVHLARSAGLGFNAAAVDDGDPRPDAWCDECEVVRALHDGWEGPAEAFARITLRCAGCYDDARRRNTTFPELAADQPYTCGGCGEIHYAVPMDFAFSQPKPYAALTESERASRATLTSDTCIIDGAEWYVRGVIEVPLADVDARWAWGVWVSLSEHSFARYSAFATSDAGIQEEPMFGWLCTSLPGYPPTTSMKAKVHLRTARLRPYIELEPNAHPLSIEQSSGITLARAIELASSLGHGKPKRVNMNETVKRKD